MSSRDPVAGARIRLTLQFGAMCAALLLGVAICLHFYVEHALLGAFDAAHDLAVRSVLECVEPSGTGPMVKEDAFAEEFDELNVTLGVVAVRVWSAEGRVLAQAGTDHAALTRNGPPRETLGAGEHLTVVRRVPFGSGDASGVVAVSRSSGEIAKELAALQRGLLFVVPLGLLGSLAIGWVMAGRSLKPVRLAFEQQRAFMADASHEIRTPLSIVQTQAEVHLQDAADSEGARAAFGVIARTAAQLGGLVNDLLFLARADVAPLAPRRTIFDIEALVEETIENFTASAKARGSTLVYTGGPEIEVRADPGQIGRLLGILIDNAIRHADPGEIHVAVEQRGRHLDIRVSDGGPGIPSNLLPRVFDRFVRGDASEPSDERGHGLGLAIARSIVAAHGGSIRLIANEKQGTTAVATLPIVHSPARAIVALN